MIQIGEIRVLSYLHLPWNAPIGFSSFERLVRFQVWDKSGSLLSPAYMKGLTSRVVGNSQNLAEHKLLEVNLNLMRVNE